jgi:hypothetical protein
MNSDFLSSDAEGLSLRSNQWDDAAVSSTDDKMTLLSIEAVQRYLNRSRASVYRYANTDPEQLNPPYDPKKLNPEIRSNKDAPLEFRPQEVRRFAEEILGLNPTIQIQPPTETVTIGLLKQILQELKAIHVLLETRQPEER